jgi:hypothetical protein
MSESDNPVEGKSNLNGENRVDDVANPSTNQEEIQTPEVLPQTRPNEAPAALPTSANDAQAYVNYGQQGPNFAKGHREGFYPQHPQCPPFAHGAPPFAGDVNFNPYINPYMSSVHAKTSISTAELAATVDAPVVDGPNVYGITCVIYDATANVSK